MGRIVIGIDSFGEEGVYPDRIERQCRRGRQAVLLRTVHARCGPQYPRKFLERQRSLIVLAPRTAVLQRLVDRQARLEIGFHQDDPFTAGHLGPRFGLLPALLSGRASACREQQRRACQHVSFHIVRFFDVSSKDTKLFRNPRSRIRRRDIPAAFFFVPLSCTNTRDMQPKSIRPVVFADGDFQKECRGHSPRHRPDGRRAVSNTRNPHHRPDPHGCSGDTARRCRGPVRRTGLRRPRAVPGPETHGGAPRLGNPGRTAGRLR